MQNYNDTMLNGGRKGKLNVKIFNGKPIDVEKQIAEFICSKPMNIERTLQSESGDGQDFGMTITIFYYTQDPAKFIGKKMTLSFLANSAIDYYAVTQEVELPKVFKFITEECIKNQEQVKKE